MPELQACATTMPAVCTPFLSFPVRPTLFFLSLFNGTPCFHVLSSVLGCHVTLAAYIEAMKCKTNTLLKAPSQGASRVKTISGDDLGN